MDNYFAIDIRAHEAIWQRARNMYMYESDNPEDFFTRELSTYQKYNQNLKNCIGRWTE